MWEEFQTKIIIPKQKVQMSDIFLRECYNCFGLFCLLVRIQINMMNEKNIYRISG